MSEDTPDVVVLREGTEGLSTEPYAEELRKRLPGHEVRRARTPAEERDLIEGARVATGVRIDEDLLAHANEIELFACAFAGTEHLPTEALRERGVTVTNAGGIHAPGLAEGVLGNMLVFARRLHEGWRRKRNREWRHFRSGELTGSTVTIVGLGSIGRALTQRLSGMEVETIGVRYSPEKGGPTDEVIGFDGESLHGALARTDYLVIACPLTETTRGLIGEDEFATLPPEAIVINTARGPIVDTDALVGAIQTNSIRGAALDVTDPEPLPPEHVLWGFENVLITPHTGGHTPKHWERLAEIVAGNVAALDGNGDLENVVLRPD
ncbi:D-2-hydroxyacid dehydrogenase [Halalkalicoccus sp. NIPERK01]|uniref:D-2-hydroxyacid dehydrogenase n=1 Tax=Halalkalicoccus sp. NIPERK01 TaxID=3053469 RepID=UPI00256EDC00|nr:D-2-hydroxyacid dehydrogenase [Halalkalicoccus sp. NIPERK01]MDL5362242.1 D-2-hydroxyacid dehydrogenase [Halalkalicoccus sp. NIPERK01]